MGAQLRWLQGSPRQEGGALGRRERRSTRYVSRELRGSEWLGQGLPGDRKEAKAAGGRGCWVGDSAPQSWTVRS